MADADEPFGPLNDLFVACFGTFLLKEEPRVPKLGTSQNGGLILKSTKNTPNSS